VLSTSLEIILRDKEICCGKNSALNDRVQSAEAKSLPDVDNKLQGRHRLSAGRPIMVTAEFVPPASINSGQLISALTEKRPLLIEWNSHLYVGYGVIYDKTLDYSSGATMDAIHKVLLVDTRFSDKRREVSFDRLTDNWGNVQGLLMRRAAPQYSRERLLLWGAGTSEMVGLRGDFIQLKSFRRAALGG
jgi:hypothetical protein